MSDELHKQEQVSAENESQQSDVYCEFGETKFSKDEAAECFKEIAGKYFDRNFGTLSKSEIDLLMFEVFNARAFKNGVTPFTDYEVARQLALTPQRVRNLRSKVALQSDDEPDWKVSFLQLITAQRYVLINSKEQEGCEVRLNFKSLIDVYAFRDVLSNRDIFQDGSFSSLVVATTLAGVLEVLFEEVAEVDCPSDIAGDGALNYLLRNASLKDLPGEVREGVENLLRDNATVTASDLSKILVKGIDRSTAPSVFRVFLPAITKLKQMVDSPDSVLGFVLHAFEGFSQINQ